MSNLNFSFSVKINRVQEVTTLKAKVITFITENMNTELIDKAILHNFSPFQALFKLFFRTELRIINL